MAPPCSVCRSPDRDAIDAAIVSGRPYRRIAAQFSTSASAIARHKKTHLSPAIVAVARERDEHPHAGEARLASARSALERIEDLARRLEGVLDSAETGGRTGAFLAAARELRSSIELLARLSGELKPEGVTVQVLNLTESPDWQATKTALMRALRPHPAALADVVAALERMDVAPRRVGPGAYSARVGGDR